jgi:hypothetical protein
VDEACAAEHRFIRRNDDELGSEGRQSFKSIAALRPPPPLRETLVAVTGLA